jgi:hypothetical protein
MWLLVIFLSPMEDSNSHSSSGIDVNPYQIRSQGGGFICMRIVPRTDVILIANKNGTFCKNKEKRLQVLELPGYISVRLVRDKKMDGIGWS